DAFIYENAQAAPRVLLATKAIAVDFARLVSEGGWPEFDPRETALLEEVGAGADAPRRPGRARILRYENSAIDIEVEAPDGGWLLLNDPWMEWWTARVDKREEPVLRANVLFRAVALPPGARLVEF